MASKVNGYGPKRLFSPPVYKPEEPPCWATYCYIRRPQFKVHSNRGHALNAVGMSVDGKRHYHARGGIIYQLVDNKWEEWGRLRGPGLQYVDFSQQNVGDYLKP